MNINLKLFFILSIISSFELSIVSNVQINEKVLAQGLNANNTRIVNVDVQVLNSGESELIGSIHVMSDLTGVSKNANGITFPSGQTVIKTFDFNHNEIPFGTRYNVEVVYGDDYSKITYGVNNQTDSPVFFNFNIP